MMNLRICLILSSILLLAACSGAREDLGLGRAPPDEFAVVDRPPLSMPPDFDLRPPRPGAPRPQDVNTSEQADKSLFPPASTNIVGANAPTGTSDIEKALLAQTGADKANPDIRDTVNHETSQKVAGNPHLVISLLDWVRGKDENPSATVNATAEAARIQEAKDKGEPLNKGATPVIERDQTGWLGL